MNLYWLWKETATNKKLHFLWKMLESEWIQFPIGLHSKKKKTLSLIQLFFGMKSKFTRGRARWSIPCLSKISRVTHVCRHSASTSPCFAVYLSFFSAQWVKGCELVYEAAAASGWKQDHYLKQTLITLRQNLCSSFF